MDSPLLETYKSFMEGHTMTNKEKLERLVEAGKKATQDDWMLMINSSKGRSVRSTGGILFNAWKPNYWQGQDERYDNELEETKSNCEFIIQAANSRQAIGEMLQENERLREALQELKNIGENGMPHKYDEWLTSHDKIFQIAKQALGDDHTDRHDVSDR